MTSKTDQIDAIVYKNKSDSAWKAFQITVGIIVAIATSFTGWCFKEVVELKQNMATIQASRFTAEDGLKVWKEIAAMQKDMALSQNNPPVWFLDKVNRIEQKIDKLEEKLTNKTASLP